MTAYKCYDQKVLYTFHSSSDVLKVYTAFA